ncbi:hypothetical protein NLG97_g9371 [Lecanicillium saksenae]|uniref:Uncharacterized protein n=1 Tax=Lecanicillium saksenae TaxID=468837 RepID=A0ACC1QGF5_9HYPO|nr:hypothetical protein NLG97_g9371 [Lecanicillium saksenae]
MKVSFALVAAMAGIAAATANPEKRGCSTFVQGALDASVVALGKFISSDVFPNVNGAAKAGAHCFKQKIDCPVDGPLAPPATNMKKVDCETGLVPIALNSAVGALKVGLGLNPFDRTDYNPGIEAGLGCFKEHFGCNPA